jgi:Uma2 family endonuclease
MKTTQAPALAEKTNGSVSGPAWEVATLFPDQGDWSEEEYLGLPGNHLVELSDGFLEFLPMPTTTHQLIVLLLVDLLNAFARSKLGLALPAPLRVRLWSGKIREPDIAFMLYKHKDRMGEEFWEGADLVMEVVSGDRKSRWRDLVTKRKEYAKAGIAEYWIVDPKVQQINVLCLKEKEYQSHGMFKKGAQATSRLLAGFAVDVEAIFAKPEFAK